LKEENMAFSAIEIKCHQYLVAFKFILIYIILIHSSVIVIILIVIKNVSMK